MQNYFGITTIIFIALLGGIIAFIGNFVGRYMGKNRLSFFRLRPRYTATTFTIIGGIVVALVTLTLASLISDNLRTALFGLDDLKTELRITHQTLNTEKDELDKKLKEKIKLENELQTLQTNLKEAREQINSLSLTKNLLEKQVVASRQGTLLFGKGDTLITTLVTDPHQNPNLQTILKQILSAADQKIRSYGIKSDQHLIYCSPVEFEKTIARLSQEQNNSIVQLIADRNTFWGETIYTSFNVLPNTLVFKKGEEIEYTEINGMLSMPEIEQQILSLLEKVNLTAKTQGVMPDAKGNIGSIPYEEISKVAKKIYFYKQKAEVTVIAKKDIYAIGPLDVTLKLNLI
ncbi:MAG: DUF3084 domain-containing protein [Candidatus Saganbacteria bacterium]|nr:DUF3084 domain-containing protein [Candidatus Saganbacteria bacterium]